MKPDHPFFEEVADYARGKLEPDRARALEEAARDNADLRQAIEQERALDRLLEFCEVEGPSEGFRERFWKDFHEGRSYGQSGRMLRWAGPLAAAALIAAGIFLFFDGSNTPLEPPQTAEIQTEDVVEFNEYRYLADPGLELEDAPALNEADLSLLSLLDDAAFAELDEVRHPDDLALARDHDLLLELAEEDLE